MGGWTHWSLMNPRKTRVAGGVAALSISSRTMASSNAVLLLPLPLLLLVVVVVVVKDRGCCKPPSGGGGMGLDALTNLPATTRRGGWRPQEEENEAADEDKECTKRLRVPVIVPVSLWGW